MKIIYSITAIVLLQCLVLQPHALAQHAYEDAMHLASMVTTQGNGQRVFSSEDEVLVYQILQRYTVLSDRDASVTTIRNRYTNPVIGNDFIRPFLSNQPQRLGAISVSASRLASTVGGMHVTNLADGLARFLAGRMKTELSLAFFERFNASLKEHSELQELFPQTYTTLKAIDTEIYNFSFFIQGLRSAFEMDIHTLPSTLHLFLQKPEYTDKIKVVTDQLRDAAASAGTPVKAAAGVAFLSYQLSAGEHPSSVINKIAHRPELEQAGPNLQSGLQLLDILSQALLVSTPEGDQWINQSDLQALIQNPEALQIFIGLIYQQANAIEFLDLAGDKKLIRDVKKELEDTFQDLVWEKINEFAAQAQFVRVILEKDSLEFGDYLSFGQSTLALLEGGLSFKSELLDLPLSEIESSFLTLFNQYNALSVNIKQKRYNAAVFDVLVILETVLKEDVLDSVRNDFLRYGTFMATVAEAESSQEVELALEAVALPAGNASIKKKSKTSLALNAYVGAGTGYERLRGEQTNFNATKLNVFAMTAPIGVAWSYGSSNQRASHSLFISMLDIGALTAYRTRNDSAKTLPEIRLENIFAPGVHYVLGVPNAPLSFSIGTQVGPGLRKITLDGIEQKRSGFRVQFAMTVDIPLINFYARPR